MRSFTTPLLVCVVVLTGRGTLSVEVFKVANYVVHNQSGLLVYVLLVFRKE